MIWLSWDQSENGESHGRKRAAGVTMKGENTAETMGKRRPLGVVASVANRAIESARQDAKEVGGFVKKEFMDPPLDKAGQDDSVVTPQPVAARTRTKSGGIAVLLAMLPGLVGLWGLGHFYTRRTMRGIILLGVGLVYLSVFFVLGFMGGLIWSLNPLLALGALGENLGLALYVFLIGTLLSGLVWLWQTVDAYRATQKWNKIVEETGERPW